MLSRPKALRFDSCSFRSSSRHRPPSQRLFVSNAEDRAAGRLFSALQPDEIEPAVSFLSGSPRQGRIGLGYAAISAAGDVPPAGDAPALTVLEVDSALSALADVTGQGSARERVQQLTTLFRRATRAEQDFLRRICTASCVRARSKASCWKPSRRARACLPPQLRRAVLMAGDLPTAARAALTGGAAALDAIVVRLLQPVRPMLA